MSISPSAHVKVCCSLMFAVNTSQEPESLLKLLTAVDMFELLRSYVFVVFLRSVTLSRFKEPL